MTLLAPDASAVLPLPMRIPRVHAVQFYETDGFLAEAVATFITEGLRNGESAILITTKPHRVLLEEQLRARSIDIGRETTAQRLVWLDASETLELFMDGDAPSAEKFFAALEPLIERLSSRSNGCGVRAFGEMVDLLWRSGLKNGAIRLEELWTKVCKRSELSLLCAYVMDRDKHEGRAAICAAHNRVLPAENAVASVAADLEDMLENAVVAIHRVDRSGVIRWANRAELEMLGYDKAEYVGRHISEFHADQDTCSSILHRLLRGEVLRDVEAALRAKDGRIRWVQVSSNMQIGEHGTTRCFSRDMTAQKHAEQDRDAVYRVAKTLNAELDLDRLVGKLVSEVTRLSRAERVVFLEAGRDEALAAMASYLEVPLVAPDGRLIGALAVGHSCPAMFLEREEKLLTAIASQAASALANARLFAAEKHARDAAERAERRTALLHGITSALSRAVSAEEASRIVVRETRAMLNAAAACVLMLGSDGAERILVEGEYDPAHIKELEQEWNHSSRPVSEAARTGKLVWLVGAPIIDARLPHLRECREALETRTWGAIPVTFEGRTLGAIGFRCTYERPLSTEDETLLLAVGRQCGQAYERARLHDATQAARAEAEHASRAKDEFLAMLGHELRNPLSPILTAVQLMRVRGETSTVREQAVIERQVTHLIHLVDDLLDISRITRGKVQLDRRPHMLASIVTKAVEIASPLCEEHRHHVTVDIPVETIWLQADETRLCQVLTNLLSNAAKYTPAGGRIAVKAKRHGSRVRISVKDNGVGIGPELLPRVFDLFVQGMRTSDRSQGGLGIGLAIVRNLVTLHGGTVSAHSEGTNRGSEFCVELPVVDMQARPVAERPMRQGLHVTPRKILVVDDNEDAGALLGEMLTSLGHDVVVALDGPRAIEAVESFSPDIAILDIGLPVMDGYELASALRLRFGSAIRLMAVTGYGQEQDKRRTQQAGFEAHFVKPVGLGKVLAAIEVQSAQS